MAEKIGTTKRALEGRRQRGIIPEGVWLLISGRVMYSIERYNEWQENQWAGLLGSSRSAINSEFASPGLELVAAKPSPIRKRQKVLRRPVQSVIK